MGKEKDITGQKFGNLTAIKKIGLKGTAPFWLFKCDCGNEKELNKYVIANNGQKLNCGYRCPKRKLHGNTINLAGFRSGSIVAIKRTKRNPNNRAWMWECRCDCGKYFESPVNTISRKYVTSCGCRINYSGDKHPNWKGGKLVTSGGYKMRLVPEHPFSQKNGYVLEHRLVMEKYLGRYLTANENVHHKNGVKDDNRIENLELWVKVQPCGQRPQDLVKFAREILETYGELF